MKTKISKQELGNDLLFDTLLALHDTFWGMGLNLYVVGAAARDIMVSLMGVQDTPRATMDLDVAVALSDWSQFDAVKEALCSNNFVKDTPKQRFHFLGKGGNNNYEVDIVPFGPIAEDEAVAWPPEGDPTMSVRCFSDVMAHAERITVGGLINIYIASLPGQFFIKLDAWFDRHLLVNKDAKDMYYMADNYFLAMVSDDETPPEEVYAGASSTLAMGARWIALESCKILSTENLKYYVGQLTEELSREESALVVDFYRASGIDTDSAFRICQDMWADIRDILSSEVMRRNGDDS